MLKLRVCGQAALGHAYALFASDFDQRELLPRMSVRRAMLRGELELLAIYDEESGIDLAYALAGSRGLYGYAWLKYLSVLPWYRERGVGVEAMRLINKRYADRQGIVTELTDFGDDGDQTLRQLRKFFARFGYVEVESDVDLGGVKDHIMVKPIRGTEALAPVIHRLLLDCYSRVLGPLGGARLPRFGTGPDTPGRSRAET